MLGTGWLSLNSPLAGPVLCQPPFIIFFASGLDRRYMGNADAWSPWMWLWMLGGNCSIYFIIFMLLIYWYRCFCKGPMVVHLKGIIQPKNIL